MFQAGTPVQAWLAGTPVQAWLAGTPVQAWLAGVCRDKPTWFSPCISVIESKETIALYNKAMHRGERRVGVKVGVEGGWRVRVEGGSGG